MSKASLRKELDTLDKQQLVEVILNTYSASKEAKEYFEFFLNPNVTELFNKKLKLIVKELNRSTRGRSRARISVLKRIISDFAAFGVGDEYVYRLVFETIKGLAMSEKYLYFSDTLANGTLKLVSHYVALANRLECVSEALDTLQNMDKGRDYFKGKLLFQARETIREINSKFNK